MDWDAYATAIRQLKDEYRGRMDILMGVELDTLYDPACCPGAEYRIGSTHFLDVDVPCETSVDWSVEKLETLCFEAFGGNWMALVRAYYELDGHDARPYGMHLRWPLRSSEQVQRGRAVLRRDVQGIS